MINLRFLLRFFVNLAPAPVIVQMFFFVDLFRAVEAAAKKAGKMRT